MIVLGMDTSCDDTSAGCINGNNILSNIVLSQVLHSEYGGVIPELAARDHIKQISNIVDRAIDKVGLKNISGIGVTFGPGLTGSLLVGLSFAKSLSYALSIPFYGVNHIEAHIFSLFIEHEIEYPFIALVVSGGHTELIIVEEKGKYKCIGTTLDDAAGEAFDKVSKMLGLSYPGGQIIEEIAKSGIPTAINFPRADVPGYNFSFSGLKTAVLYYLKSQKSEVRSQKSNIAASFQEAVVDSLIAKLIKAATDFKIKRVGIVGGVASNIRLRQKLKNTGIDAYFPNPKLCTDNGVMVAMCANFYLDKCIFSPYNLRVSSSASL
ncbi:MAG: tRNA (adenosine(37)-N6)-threonylcarbamoyltransferase complex transferase subunit TsaD [Candidatus Stahlbacteria bacterium]|nr:tRNA (adenosine(37)-N6)-threonylcarbamoyltransferase complex transferase subunit TsaD [Candidatus Stahlbacteria bacterium]